MIQIANPIYNEAFSYLMANQKAAWIVLSALLGEDIELVDLQPQERSVNVEHVLPFLSRVRFGYVASVNILGKREKVFIELQKCNIPRNEVLDYFRAHYPQAQPARPHSFLDGMPVIVIYIMGFDGTGSHAEVSRFTMQDQDVVTCAPFSPHLGTCLNASTPLIYFIRLAQEPSKEATRIQRVLSIFAQNQRYVMDDKKLVVSEESKMDPIIGRIVSRLEGAWADDKTRRNLIEEEAFEKMILRNREEAKQQGREEGFRLGVAQRILSLVADDALIAVTTGVSLEQVQALRDESQSR